MKLLKSSILAVALIAAAPCAFSATVAEQRAAIVAEFNTKATYEEKVAFAKTQKGGVLALIVKDFSDKNPDDALKFTKDLSGGFKGKAILNLVSAFTESVIENDAGTGTGTTQVVSLATWFAKKFPTKSDDFVAVVSNVITEQAQGGSGAITVDEAVQSISTVAQRVIQVQPAAAAQVAKSIVVPEGGSQQVTEAIQQKVEQVVQQLVASGDISQDKADKLINNATVNTNQEVSPS